eukprot:SRR837773.16272.p1 GENE.SRR837773.16272~~SRR837773.16272.p1  ORF type:complete len:255 (-),score=70.81 SRR837773.16272:22-723(-)
MDATALQCAGLAFQTVGFAVLLGMYLRTTVARAVLDARRSRLLVTSCALFGEPGSEQELPLMAIQPGPFLMDTWIKFRVRGPIVDPSTWIWYRIPRVQLDGGVRKKGVQMGFTAEPVAAMVRPEQEKLRGPPVNQGPQGRRFPGLGKADGDDDGFGSSGPKRGARAAPAAPASRGRSDGEAPSWASAAIAAPMAKSLSDLRLVDGLPRDAREEQKIIDFLEDPMAYGSFKVQS